MDAQPRRGTAPRPLLVAIDVQRLYRDFGPWRLPDAERVSATIAAIADASGCPLVCTRAVLPSAAAVTSGPWAAYERRWRTLAERVAAEPTLLDPFPELGARSQAVFDKHTYSAFEAPEFADFVASAAPDPLVVAGIETDICVLATVFGAIDRNLEVWLVTDALAGPDPDAAGGVLATMARLPDQVRLLSADTVTRRLRGGA